MVFTAVLHSMSWTKPRRHCQDSPSASITLSATPLFNCIDISTHRKIRHLTQVINPAKQKFKLTVSSRRRILRHHMSTEIDRAERQPTLCPPLAKDTSTGRRALIELGVVRDVEVVPLAWGRGKPLGAVPGLRSTGSADVWF